MELIDDYISIDSENYRITSENYHKPKFIISTHDFWLFDFFVALPITMNLYKTDKPTNIITSSDFIDSTFCTNIMKKININVIRCKQIIFFNHESNKGAVDKVCQLLKNGENVGIAIKRNRFFNSSGLFHIFNFINENNIDLDIVEISMLSKDKLDKINFTINKHIHHRLTNLVSHHIFDILRFKDFSKNKKLYYKSKLHKPFSYTTKKEFMEKMYKSLYEIED